MDNASKDTGYPVRSVSCCVKAGFVAPETPIAGSGMPRVVRSGPVIPMGLRSPSHLNRRHPRVSSPGR